MKILRILLVVILCSVTTTAQAPQPPPPAVVDAVLTAIEKAVTEGAAASAAMAKSIAEQAAILRKAMEPPPPPIDCEQGPWTLAAADTGQWSACQLTNGQWQQTRDELWRRSIITEPANGGKACGADTEARVAVQPCTPPSGPLLLQESDLVYEGAFRVPSTYSWSGAGALGGAGGGIAYNAKNNSLYLANGSKRIGEIRIVTPATGVTVASLPIAPQIQVPTDVLQGKLGTVDGDPASGVLLGGIMPVGTSLIVSAWRYYDNGAGNPPIHQQKTHFVSGQNFSSLPTVTGPFQVGSGFYPLFPNPSTALKLALDQRIGGFVSGYMTSIPAMYHAVLGGTHLSGQGGGVSILRRTSAGPSATVFTPTDLGTPAAITNATLVMGYPNDSSDPSSPLNRPTLGTWGVVGGTYDGTQNFRGMVFPDGTRSILFFGWGGERPCYGVGTADLALDLKPVPGNLGVKYCYDPVDLNKGMHGYPNRGLAWAYDVDEFIAVRNGLKKPWDLRPYARWTFSLPFQQKLVSGIDRGTYDIVGSAYDSATKRIFLSAFRQDGDAPLIHVYKVP